MRELSSSSPTLGPNAYRHVVFFAGLGLGQESAPVPVPDSWEMMSQSLGMEPPTSIVLLILSRAACEWDCLYVKMLCGRNENDRP